MNNYRAKGNDFYMNITEFAKIAGVSKSAVSRYFNDGYLSEDKRKQIEDAIEKTGYSPSIQAHNACKRITRLVGVIIPKISSESCAREVEGISRVLNEKGYQILLVNSANNHQKEVEYLDLFRNNRVDGVIFLATIFTPRHEAILKKMRVPVVIVGQEYKGFCCVCHDDFSAAYAITELMIKKGGKNPGFIGVTESDKAAGLARKKGFLKALHDYRIEIQKNNMITADFTMDSGYEKAEILLKNHKRPDFIFCATDNIGAGAVICAHNHKINIPEKLMISGIGDSHLCKVTSSSLTSVHFHYETAGEEAAHMLLLLLKKENIIPKTLTLDYEIMERESTQRQ